MRDLFFALSFLFCLGVDASAQQAPSVHDGIHENNGKLAQASNVIQQTQNKPPLLVSSQPQMNSGMDGPVSEIMNMPRRMFFSERLKVRFSFQKLPPALAKIQGTQHQTHVQHQQHVQHHQQQQLQQQQQQQRGMNYTQTQYSLEINEF